MPLFEYHCESCDVEFELLIRGDESPACPECGRGRVDRLISAPAAPIIRGSSLPLASDCPPLSAGPCKPNCCRLPQ